MPHEDGPGVSEDEIQDVTPLVQSPTRKTKATGEAKGTPPNAAEWQDFFGRIVIKSAANVYVTWMLGDFEEELTAHERQSIMLTDEDIDDMSAPLAGFATKNKFLQRKGRTILSLANSWEAVLAMAIWARRVRKVARKHYAAQVPTPPQQPRPIVPPPVQTGDPNGNARSNDGQGQSPYPPDGIVIFNPGAG